MLDHSIFTLGTIGVLALVFPTLKPYRRLGQYKSDLRDSTRVNTGLRGLRDCVVLVMGSAAGCRDVNPKYVNRPKEAC